MAEPLTPEEERRQAIADDRAWQSGYSAGRAAAARAAVPSPDDRAGLRKAADELLALADGGHDCGTPEDDRYNYLAVMLARAALLSEPPLDAAKDEVIAALLELNKVATWSALNRPEYPRLRDALAEYARLTETPE